MEVMLGSADQIKIPLQLRSGLPFGPRSQASLQKAQGPGLCKLPNRGEAKDSALLSSRDAGLLVLLVRMQAWAQAGEGWVC